MASPFKIAIALSFLFSFSGAFAQEDQARLPEWQSRQGALSESEIQKQVTQFGRLHNMDSTTLATYDRIITYDREVFIGKIYNITFTDVRYSCPPDDQLHFINKSRISQILYADGRRDVFIALEGRNVKQHELVDTNRIIIKTTKDWMKVVVTEDPEDAHSLVEVGKVMARYEADKGNVSNEELFRRAAVILRKKAVVMKAHLVLVESKFYTKAYGDLPKVELIARAFSYQ